MRSVKVRGTNASTDIATAFVPGAPGPISKTSEIANFTATSLHASTTSNAG